MKEQLYNQEDANIVEVIQERAEEFSARESFDIISLLFIKAT